MDVTYPAPPTVLTDWKSIAASLIWNLLWLLDEMIHGFSPIPHFAPIPPSNVAPSFPIDMEQRLSSLSDTVASLAGSIKEGIQQNNLILARQQGQANQ
ncbi:hypothetical protein RIR_jg15672.t1 [Rhizophagus irregularis DAOM 181602=DAOM 197198]|nr:hypothetical protein RIR_jg15672.t1 [Rhizophagus irregularis DAOM 181602=DAOM 197198]